MAKKAARKTQGSLPDPNRNKVIALREVHAKLWMEAQGFQGNFQRNGRDFLAHELGLSRDFVAAILDGAAHLGVRSALAMRRAIARTAQIKDYDYRVFTELVYEVLGLGDTPVSNSVTSTAEEPIVSNEEIAAGVDDAGRNCLVVMFADGSKASVILPAGTIVDGKPTVMFGKNQTTGSITLLLVREESSS